ncbi:tyrosine-protein phosphatase [Mangrovibacillus cuniculi]|uniref:Tyrosine-protein phosphatase n=1 Tax=Mangrovibacillus cuniculi TaxID=2593652 RepID=A0A7S8HGK9_9BACI|nr:CpsB/CapC family capsule biosynthesis tyrosine phosphatase [Mangrovibacillus cuniculi]QPC47661.1 tyrosine protein phosphatase [Mangrovibacillus cuniculi]
MIDIHSHILPGIDDGAKHEQESLEMARQASKEGVRTIIATPHFDSRFRNTASEVKAAVEIFNELLKQYDIPVSVLPGQEVHIGEELLENLDKEIILPITQLGHYMLVELPSSSVPFYTDQLLYDLSLKGIVPIIAHPERNAELIENPDKLYKLVKNGVLTQVTSASIAGKFGKKIQRFSESLIESNLTHFIASDAHNTSSRNFYWEKAWNTIDKKFGADYHYLFSENAELLVANRNVQKEIPSRVKQRKFLGMF